MASPGSPDSADPDAQWARIASELIAYRDSQRGAWGDLDDVTLARFVAGESTPQEAATVQRAMQLHPKLRECVDILRDVLEPDMRAMRSAASLAQPPGRDSAQKRQRRWLYAMTGMAAAASFALVALSAFGTRRAMKTTSVAGGSAFPAFPTNQAEAPRAVKTAPDSQPAPPPAPTAVAANIPAPTQVREVPNERSPATPPKGDGETAATNRGAHASPRTSETAVATLDMINAGEAAGPREEWSSAIAAKKPTRAKETLDGILASRVRFQNQLVIPEGMYCLEDNLRILGRGGVQVRVNQSRIELARDGSPSVRTLKTLELEIEPKLANALREARQQEPLNIRPAILTVWVTGRGECRLVGADFLVRFQPRLNPNGIPDVDYYTLNVSPEGVRPGKAKDEDWETLPRMLNIKNRCERQLMASKSMKRGMTQAQIEGQMNTMFSSMMKTAAVESSRDAVLRKDSQDGRPSP